MFSSRRKIGFEGQRCSSSTTTTTTATQEYSPNYLMSWVAYILLARSLVPPEIRYILRQCWALLMRPYTSFFCVFHIYERNKGTSGGTGKNNVNDLFRLVDIYLNVAGLCKVADEVVLTTKSKKQKDILYKLTGMKSKTALLLVISTTSIFLIFRVMD